MKKTTLLFALLLSINNAHGMKRMLEIKECLPAKETHFPLAILPTEAKAVVIESICTYDNLDDIITTINVMKCVNREFNKIVKQVFSQYVEGYSITNENDENKDNALKKFTGLIHYLSDKFPTITTEAIAKKLKIPTAKKYIELGKSLLMLSGTKKLDDIQKLIADGADIDFTTSFIVDKATGAYHVYTPFFFAITMINASLIELLHTKIKPKTLDTAYETLKKINEARSKLRA